MKNKIELKKTITISIIIYIEISLALAIIKINEYKTYEKNYNKKIETITAYLIENYPNLKEEELIKIINNQETKQVLKDYGINVEKDTIIKQNKNKFIKYTIQELTLTALLYILVITIYLKYNKNKDKQIKDITQLINQINKNNYTIKIDDLTEDELSILKQEIYKTTIMLREQAENSTKDKIEVKKSIEDISHQLKTPLTSILINIENITENTMDEKTKEKFLKEIKKETYNIKQLIETLLKLSKFDVNTIEFNNKEEKLEELVEDSINKISTLADLKNITIEKEITTNENIICDKKWQIEALSNIIKNAIEHSIENTKINIKIETNKIYKQITITNYDAYINEQDQKHIFERFYKAQNSKEESIGIGLALSKKIIEKNNGTIELKSNKEKTQFIIKYFSTRT